MEPEINPTVPSAIPQLTIYEQFTGLLSEYIGKLDPCARLYALSWCQNNVRDVESFVGNFIPDSRLQALEMVAFRMPGFTEFVKAREAGR